jgi:hypothetical protein
MSPSSVPSLTNNCTPHPIRGCQSSVHNFTPHLNSRRFDRALAMQQHPLAGFNPHFVPPARLRGPLLIRTRTMCVFRSRRKR